MKKSEPGQPQEVGQSPWSHFTRKACEIEGLSSDAFADKPCNPKDFAYDLTVGMCSRNRQGIFEKTLRSLTDQTWPADRFQVVVVNDGSTDGTAEMLEKIAPELPYPLVVCHQPHSGLATARNTGIRASSGWVMLYIDDDVLADPRLIEEHLNIHRAHDKIVCNGWVNHVTEPVRPEKPTFTMADISTSFFWTSNVSVKLEHLIEAGMFDEDFKEYGWEDQELGLRLMELGLTKKNNYKAIGFHVKAPPKPTNIQGAIAQAEAKARTALVYISKHPRHRSRFATGLHAPRLAWAAFSNMGGLLERRCRYELSGLDPQDSSITLTSKQAWCLKQLCTIHYFRVLRQGGLNPRS